LPQESETAAGHGRPLLSCLRRPYLLRLWPDVNRCRRGFGRGWRHEECVHRSQGRDWSPPATSPSAPSALLAMLGASRCRVLWRGW